MDFPIKNGDFPHSYVSLPEGKLLNPETLESLHGQPFHEWENGWAKSNALDVKMRVCVCVSSTVPISVIIRAP